MAALEPPREAACVTHVKDAVLVERYGLKRGRYPDTASAAAFFLDHEALPGDILAAKSWNDVFRETEDSYFVWDGHRAHKWDEFDGRVVPDRYPVRYWAQGRLANVLHEVCVDVRARRDELLANLRFGLPAGARGYVYSPLLVHAPPGLPGAYTEHGRCLELYARPGEFIRGARGAGRPRGFVHTTFAHCGVNYCLVLEEHGTAYGPPDEDVAALVEAFQGVLSREDHLVASVSGDLERCNSDPDERGRFLPWWGRRAPTPLYYTLPPEEYPPNLDLAGAVPWRVKSWMRWNELGHDDPEGDSGDDAEARWWAEDGVDVAAAWGCD